VVDERRVQELIDEILDSGRTPEAVCAACPDLLPEVRHRWEQVCAVEAELDALFPTPGIEPHPKVSPARHLETELPRIPGYEVEALLGRGGMGVVYRARHVRLNRRVALKMLLAGAYAAPEELARFEREAEAVAGLQHPNIVQLYDVGDHNDRPYFTMEFVEGGSLGKKLVGTPQPARQAAELAATLAEAVQVAHHGGIVHRDLKPANILLTADGTPKIADFGLARHFDAEPGLTFSGARLGTPSYMAPEQALGNVRTVGPSVDVYSLGALLYELVTGRPPFRGESAAETELQVIYQDPVPPSRLNSKVPRDLETICLKCLDKDPGRRYATAAALAEDLRRFLHGDPIAARRASLLERSRKWVRHHPTKSTLLAAGAVFAVMLVGASLWLFMQQARQRDAVQADLKELGALQESARWTDARTALERATERFGGAAPADVRKRIDQAGRDLDLLIRLNNVRLRRVTRGLLVFYQKQADREYQEAFRAAGLGNVNGPPASFAAGVKASAVRGPLLTALDDWAACSADKTRRDWLLEVARQVAPDPQGWRRRVMDGATWDNQAALTEFARSAPAGQPVSLLLALAERLRVLGGDSTPVLKRVQEEYPADFWANLTLGNALLQLAPQEAAGYYRAALASRPAAAVGYCAVGDALRLQHALVEAIDYYKKALSADPAYARAHSDLGLALQAQDHLDEAVECYRKAIQFDSDYAWAHLNLGNALRRRGQIDEAYGHYREVIRIDPKNTEVYQSLASILVPRGRGQEALADWQQALASNPPGHLTWLGYAELCLFLGQEEEYRRTRRELLARFGTTREPYTAEPIGRTCLLLPAEGLELRQSSALIDTAVAAKASIPGWIYRYFLFAAGLEAYRQDRYDAAIALMEGEAATVLGPCPRLVIAMAQHRSGHKSQARKTLATAVVEFDWNANQVDNRDVWLCHILRREAEVIIVPELPKIVEAKYQPRDNDERLAALGFCQSHGLHRTAARLYAEALANDPELENSLASESRSRASRTADQPLGRVEELYAGSRYPAARSAALAGCGLSEDAAKLDDAERSHWRRLARQWLHADLAMWAKLVESNSPPARQLAKQTLTRWQKDPDLAGFRDPDQVETLPPAEREELRALWSELASALNAAAPTK
jgi:serine/threonine-protein kinase